MSDAPLFDFDTPVLRRGSHCHKWDDSDDPGMLPMWVADMDFRTAPAVVEALQRRAEHGVFGYTRVPERYFEAIIGWYDRRHGMPLKRDWLLYTTGVVPALSAIIQALAQPGDGVIVQTPAYNCFFSSIRNSGCRQVDNPLRQDADGYYQIDFEDLTVKAADPKNRFLLLCNPHNPVGRVWRREELEQLGQICQQHGVIVIADEIHSDLIRPGFRHTPFAAVNEACRRGSITCSAPSKTFNLAGLQTANIIVADPEWRRRIDRQININETCELNPFGVEALIAAYTEGEAWLEALRAYLAGNYAIVEAALHNLLPQLRITPLEATYLAWIDCTALEMPSQEIAQRLRDRHHLWLSEGILYGDAGEGFIRLNFACSRDRLQEGIHRLRAAFTPGGALSRI
ncbi:cystathione beta-lyase [Kushneria avicenniae]|uniref:cysteine-S-conjugate beta-lyase n=1 Tax=Kushneria avicenniae TaxID=402385 RepID=A0A1I1G9E6_9GAMM|nr:MalY/PatB family protein [Kushneria avicenniae]SFC06458.1 cystathione beta-lyase [Kushneria avicenniae]